MKESIERLANYAHVSWAGWMKYLFKNSQIQSDGSVIIPKHLVDRWARQIQTPYIDLPENEKNSDRNEAKQMLRHLHNPPPGAEKDD